MRIRCTSHPILSGSNLETPNLPIRLPTSARSGFELRFDKRRPSSKGMRHSLSFLSC
jgi:hypothetical protein